MSTMIKQTKNNPEWTTIPITKDTRSTLQSLMKYGETYDGIIQQLIEKFKTPVCPYWFCVDNADIQCHKDK